MIVLCDLDGTLADITHRLHYVKDGAHDWDSFYKECVNDNPIKSIIELVRCLSEFHEIWIVSGRGSEVREETLSWLRKWNILFDVLIMRPEKDYTPDDQLKKSWLDTGMIPKEEILLAIDDRQKVVDMWRANGIKCLQVAKGDF